MRNNSPPISASNIGRPRVSRPCARRRDHAYSGPNAEGARPFTLNGRPARTGNAPTHRTGHDAKRVQGGRVRSLSEAFVACMRTRLTLNSVSQNPTGRLFEKHVGGAEKLCAQPDRICWPYSCAGTRAHRTPLNFQCSTAPPGSPSSKVYGPSMPPLAQRNLHSPPFSAARFVPRLCTAKRRQGGPKDALTANRLDGFERQHATRGFAGLGFATIASRLGTRVSIIV